MFNAKENVSLIITLIAILLRKENSAGARAVV